MYILAQQYVEHSSVMSSLMETFGNQFSISQAGFSQSWAAWAVIIGLWAFKKALSSPKVIVAGSKGSL